MTVAELQARLTNAEYIAWQAYHGRRAQRAELDAKMARHRAPGR